LNLLEGVEGFEYKDYSVPKDDPIETKTESKKELEEALERQIQAVSVVVVPAGMYAAHRGRMLFSRRECSLIFFIGRSTSMRRLG
jgi:hypothetical protein